jgi:hypothetical protein
MTQREFSTRMELKSLTQQSECAGAESGCLRMISESLGDSSMCLEAPFIAPRQLGAIGGQQERLSLPSRWRTRQSLYMVWYRSPSYSGTDDRCISGPDGAPDIVRCTPDSPVPPPTVASGDRGFRGRPLRWRPLAHRTIRCTTGQSSEL